MLSFYLISLGICHIVRMYVCVHLCTYRYTHIHASYNTSYEFYWVLLRFCSSYSLLQFLPLYTAQNGLADILLNWNLRVEKHLAAVPPVFSPPLGVAPCLIIYKALSLLFLNSGPAHLQMTYIHVTDSSSVFCCITLLNRKSSTV